MRFASKLLFNKIFLLVTFVISTAHSYQGYRPVLFDYDQKVINSKAKKQISQIVDKVRAGDTVLLKGFADPSGEEAYNGRLSLERARAVKAALEAKIKVNNVNIKIVHFGEDGRVNIEDTFKRRVEVYSGTEEEISWVYQNGKNYNLMCAMQKDVPPVVTDCSSGEKRKRGHRYYGKIGVYHNVITAEDIGSSTEAEWVSENNIFVEGAYQMDLAKNFWVGFKLGYHMQDYKIEAHPIFTWDEETNPLIKGSIITDYERQRWAWGVDLDYNGEQFFIERNTALELRDIYMMGFSFRGKYKWYKGEKWSSRIGLKVELPLMGADEIAPKGKGSVIGSIDLRRHNPQKRHGINCSAFYGVRNFSNTQNDQSEELVGLSCGMQSLKWF